MSVAIALSKWPAVLLGGSWTLGGVGSDFEQALVSHLTNDAGVSALVASRVYPEPVPQNATYPLICYMRIASTHEHVMGGAAGYLEARYQIKCWASSRSAVKTLADAVRLALDGYSGAMGDATVRGIFFDSDDDDYVPASQAQAHARHGLRMDFVCNYTEAVP